MTQHLPATISYKVPENFPHSRLHQAGPLLLLLHLVDAVDHEVILPGLVQLVEFVLKVLQGVLHPLHLAGGVLGGGAQLAEGPAQLGLDGLDVSLETGDGVV